MSESLDRFKNEHSSWFVSLDDTVRCVFDKMFRKHPQDMYQALTGEGAPDDLPRIGTLTDVLNPDGALSSTDVVPYFATFDLVVEPEGPDANTEFTVRWTDTNMGVDSRGHADVLQILDHDTAQTVFTSDRIEVGALASGGTAANEVKVPALVRATASAWAWRAKRSLAAMDLPKGVRVRPSWAAHGAALIGPPARRRRRR